MYVTHLGLTDFRTYESLDFKAGPGIFVFIGDNAQGKTNLLEAVALCANGRSFRAASDKEVVRWGAEGQFTRIDLDVERNKGPLQVEIVIAGSPESASSGSILQEDIKFAPPAPLGRKRIRINGTPRRAIDLISQINLVLFAPSDLELVSGSPQDRRRFLDIALCQVNQSYCRALLQYQKIVTQRSALLRRIQTGDEEISSLSYWDTQLADLAALIMYERKKILEFFQNSANSFYQQLSGTSESLSLAYQPASHVEVRNDPQEMNEEMRKALVSVRQREIHQGVCLVGPHRDDFIITGDTHNIGVFGSRGQQRTAALALKLAELEYLKKESGEEPILLLDDVMSELDEKRRAYLMNVVSHHEQVWITATELDKALQTLVPVAKVFEVQSGKVLPS